MNELRKPTLEIDGRGVGSTFPCFVIAEIGTGHQGDRYRALKLLDGAAEAGADCVKTQAVIAEEILHPSSGEVDLPGGRVPLFERFRSLEQDPEFYRFLKDETEKRGMLFLCTPFGLESAAMLKELGVKAVKVASPELNHYALLRALSFGVPLILSTGVSTLGDIEKALAAAGPKTALLHCVTAYPAPPEEYNLRVLDNLGRIFGVTVGVSDHSSDPLLVPLTAAHLGAALLEKHMTLEKTGTGLDDTFALEPAEFKTMVQTLRQLEEMPREKQEQWLYRRFGENTIKHIAGDGVKRLSPSEEKNYRTSNRSILALHDLAAGTTLTSEHVALLRSEKNLSPGLGPENLDIVIGKKLVRPVESGKGITWKDLLQEAPV